MINGNVEQLLVPKDSRGRKCGHEVDTKDKPNLLFFDLTKCIGPKVLLEGCKTPQVCPHFYYSIYYKCQLLWGACALLIFYVAMRKRLSIIACHNTWKRNF